MLVSVVIPSFNHQKYIQTAVDSVLSQTHEELELIIVDDGSSDNSLDYLRSVKDKRVKLIEQQNAGAHSAINRGLALAKGAVLTVLNSDDLYHVNRIENCLKIMHELQVDLVATWIQVINEKGKPQGVKKGWKNMLPWDIDQTKNTFACSNDFVLNLLMTNFVSTTSNMLFKREVYEKIGGMRNLRFAHDWDFLLRVGVNFKCHLIEQPLMSYRIHESNTISSNRKWMMFEICWVLAVALRAYRARFWKLSSEKLDLIADTECFFESINLQGNDKVFWMINAYIEARNSHGSSLAEEELLNDPDLRGAFLKYVVS